MDEGYEAVTMRGIADRIEYSPTALYCHFKDKGALLRELCDEDFAALARQFQKIAGEKDPIERLRQIGKAYVSFGLEHPFHYRLMFMTPHPPIASSDEGQARRSNSEEDAYAFLKATVAAGLAEGRFRPGLTDADLLAQTVWAGTHGVVSLHIAKCNDDWIDWKPVPETASLLIDALVAGLAREQS